MSSRIGALLWIVQPLYLLAEFLTAAKVAVPYSFTDNTISDLGATTCTSIEYAYGPVPVCSSWHTLMNGSFLVFGVFLVFGAVLIRPRLPSGPGATTSVVLWGISGISSIGTGLVPLDRDLELHVLVSFPVFVAQPFALVTLGLALRRHCRGLVWPTFAVGVLSLMGTGVFLVRIDAAGFGGLWERLALWPGYLWLPVVAIAILRTGTRRDVAQAAATSDRTSDQRQR